MGGTRSRSGTRQIVRINFLTKVEFCSNHIKSSKYTVLTFWVLNPFEQFRRMANFTYLVMAVVQVGWANAEIKASFLCQFCVDKLVLNYTYNDKTGI